MTMIKKCISGLLVLLLTHGVLAQTSEPHQRIEQATQKMIQVIEQNRQYFDTQPELYYQRIAEVVEPLVDFPSFTRSVMGVYGTRDYYQSLVDAEAKKQFRENYQQFTQVFKRGLLQTYAKGLLAFNGQAITVQAPSAQDLQQVKNAEMVDVQQFIQHGDEKFQVTYKMRPDQQGQWLLRNVIIESVNVGQLYRNQFEASMKKYQQDFAQVIAHWSDDTKDATKELKQKAH